MKNKDKFDMPESLKAYVERIGAEQINFRKFIVKIYKGNYYHEKAIISVDSDGTVKTSHEDYQPTESEQSQISNDFSKGVNYPSQIQAKKASLKSLKINKSSDLFVFLSFDRTGIEMVQEKRVKNDGTKQYIPWTLFDDGQWRALEPDKGLPMWKPEKIRNKPKIMIHEGAKAAQEIDDLVNNPKRKKELEKHPFGKEFEQFEHWGIIGGALAPHRTNYKDLIRFKATKVIYVCDNDEPGKSALSRVSKLYGQSLLGIQFDKLWPMAFDFADPIPEKFFNAKGSYNGPDFKDLLVPATWATVKIEKPGKGRPTYKLNSYFEKEWLHSVIPDAYIHESKTHHIYSSDNFNDLVCPFSDVDNVARLFRKNFAQKAVRLGFDPSKPNGIFIYENDIGITCINTHSPGNVKPVKGDPKPFLDFMEHLFPVESDRLNVMKWACTLIAKPEIKMSYGILLISEQQGVGKTTLGESILAPILGPWNCSFPTETEIVDSQFNEWAAGKRLAIVNEIYAGHSAKAYNKLKGIITDKTITVNKKFQAQYIIDNWLHMFACSNSMHAVKMDNDDRRWLVPKITNQQKPDSYWKRFYHWLNNENGLEIIHEFAHDWVSKNGYVERGSHAPTGEWKKEVITETLGRDASCIVQTLQRLIEENPNENLIVTDQELVRLIRNKYYRNQPEKAIMRPLTARKLARNAGWFVCENKFQNCSQWGIQHEWNFAISNDISIERKSLLALLEDRYKKVSFDEIFEEKF